MKMENRQPIPWQVSRYEDLRNTGRSVYFDVDDFEEIIDHYLADGAYQEALHIAEHASGVHPSSIPIMLKKAQLLASFNKEDHALDLLTTVETLDPHNNDIFLTKGAIYSQLKNYEKAIEEYNKAVFGADEPDFVYCNIAFEYENLGNFDKTLEYLDKALSINPDNDLAIYEAAYCFDLLSLTEEGISFFQRLIDRNPYSTEAWFNLGVSYINAGHYERAMQALDYALLIDGKHEHSWFHKGYALSLMNRHNESIEAYKQSMDSGEDDAMKCYYIGECYEKMEEYAMAREWYLKGTERDPTLADAWIGIGVCEIEEGNAPASVNYFKKGIELDPDNVSYLCLLANAYFVQGHYEDTWLTYEKALKLDPDDEETWLEYAETLSNAGKHSEAHQLLHRGTQSMPGNNTLLYSMAAFLFMDGKVQQGTFFLEEACNLAPGGLKALTRRFPAITGNAPFMEAADRLA